MGSGRTSSRPERRVVGLVVAVCVVLASACGPTTTAPTTPTTVPVPSGTGDTADTADGTVTPAPAPGATPTGDPGEPAAPGATEAPAPASPTADDASAATPPPAPADTPAGPTPIDADGPLASACRPLLQPAIASRVIEVDAQAGAELSGAVLDHLAGTLRQVADAPGGVTVDASGRIEGEAREWTLEDIRAVEAGSRSIPQTGDTAVVHVVALRGQPDQSDPGIASSIGIAFGATSFVVFPDRVDDLAILLGGADAILRAVVVHELGHVLCLVNLSYESEIDHEDPDHPGHSRDSGSVMFHAIETTAIGQLFQGPPPSTFTAEDLADLEGLRTGRY